MSACPGVIPGIRPNAFKYPFVFVLTLHKSAQDTLPARLNLAGMHHLQCRVSSIDPLGATNF